MHLKVFVKLKKTLKTLSSGQKNPKKNKKTRKTKKTQKKPNGLGLKKKPGFFPTLGQGSSAAPPAPQRQCLHQGGVCGGCAGDQRHLCAAPAPPVPPVPPGHGEPAPAGRSYARVTPPQHQLGRPVKHLQQQ